MRGLPVVEIAGTQYFLDERLDEMRNVKDPNDVESMEGMGEAWWLATWGNKTLDNVRDF